MDYLANEELFKCSVPRETDGFCYDSDADDEEESDDEFDGKLLYFYFNINILLERRFTVPKITSKYKVDYLKFEVSIIYILINNSDDTFWLKYILYYSRHFTSA